MGAMRLSWIGNRLEKQGRQGEQERISRRRFSLLYLGNLSELGAEIYRHFLVGLLF